MIPAFYVKVNNRGLAGNFKLTFSYDSTNFYETTISLNSGETKEIIYTYSGVASSQPIIRKWVLSLYYGNNLIDKKEIETPTISYGGEIPLYYAGKVVGHAWGFRIYFNGYDNESLINKATFYFGLSLVKGDRVVDIPPLRITYEAKTDYATFVYERTGESKTIWVGDVSFWFEVHFTDGGVIFKLPQTIYIVDSYYNWQYVCNTLGITSPTQINVVHALWHAYDLRYMRGCFDYKTITSTVYPYGYKI